MTCPAFRDIQTGLFSSVRILCEGKHKPGKPHRSGWISGSTINQLTWTAMVRVEWVDA